MLLNTFANSKWCGLNLSSISLSGSHSLNIKLCDSASPQRLCKSQPPVSNLYVWKIISAASAWHKKKIKTTNVQFCVCLLERMQMPCLVFPLVKWAECGKTSAQASPCPYITRYWVAGYHSNHAYLSCIRKKAMIKNTWQPQGERVQGLTFWCLRLHSLSLSPNTHTTTLCS